MNVKRCFGAAAIAALLLPAPPPASAQALLTGDTRLACEAILCLSSGQRPDECTPSLKRFFGIKHRKWRDTIRARKKFLQLCPEADEDTVETASRTDAGTDPPEEPASSATSIALGSKPKIYAMAVPTVSVAQGDNAIFPIRYEAGDMPFNVIKPVIFIIDKFGRRLATAALDVGNHYYQIDVKRWFGRVQYEYPFLMNGRYVPPGTYRIRLTGHEGVEPYRWDPSLFECMTGPMIDGACEIGSLVVTESDQTPSDLLTRGQGYTVMSGTRW